MFKSEKDATTYSIDLRLIPSSSGQFFPLSKDTLGFLCRLSAGFF